MTNSLLLPGLWLVPLVKYVIELVTSMCGSAAEILPEGESGKEGKKEVVVEEEGGPTLASGKVTMSFRNGDRFAFHGSYSPFPNIVCCVSTLGLIRSFFHITTSLQNFSLCKFESVALCIRTINSNSLHLLLLLFRPYPLISHTQILRSDISCHGMCSIGF